MIQLGNIKSFYHHSQMITIACEPVEISSFLFSRSSGALFPVTGKTGKPDIELAPFLLWSKVLDIFGCKLGGDTVFNGFNNTVGIDHWRFLNGDYFIPEDRS